MSQIPANIASIRERISAAAKRAGLSPEEITLMAVTKRQPPESIIAAYQAGIRSFGENRVQEFQAKRDNLDELKDASFALIGSLQSNKVNRAVELFSAIHSVDSIRLAERLNSAVERDHKPAMPVAIEINSGDPAKAGLASDSPELEQLLLAAEHLPYIRIQGLMTIPPLTENPEDARPYFKRLRELRDRIATRKLPSVGMELLSMGMSHDFEIAVQEGSTCVRIGTAIFGERR